MSARSSTSTVANPAEVTALAFRSPLEAITQVMSTW